MNNKHTTLINTFIKSKGDDISDKTKTNYKNTFLRLLNMVLGKNKRLYIMSRPTKQILKSIDESDTTTNAKITVLQLYKYLLEYTDKSTKQIIKRLNEYFNMVGDTRKTTNKKILNTSIKYDELIEILKHSDNIDYILFYLLIRLNCRNNDLIILYTDDLKLKKGISDGAVRGNILYFNNRNELLYIRNDYKTSKVYGAKINIITDEKFKRILKTLPINKNIFINSKDKPYTSDEINKFIQSRFKQYTKKPINQTIIYKILVQHHELTNDNNGLKKIAINRGHTRDTQENYYSTTSTI